MTTHDLTKTNIVELRKSIFKLLFPLGFRKRTATTYRRQLGDIYQTCCIFRFEKIDTTERQFLDIQVWSTSKSYQEKVSKTPFNPDWNPMVAFSLTDLADRGKHFFYSMSKTNAQDDIRNIVRDFQEFGIPFFEECQTVETLVKVLEHGYRNKDRAGLAKHPHMEMYQLELWHGTISLDDVPDIASYRKLRNLRP